MGHSLHIFQLGKKQHDFLSFCLITHAFDTPITEELLELDVSFTQLYPELLVICIYEIMEWRQRMVSLGD